MKRAICLVFLTLSIGSSLLYARMPEELKFKPLEFKPPQAEKRVLSCGATVFLLPDPELPVINLSAMIRTGTMYDPPDKTGLARLCGIMIRAGGTKSRKADDIDDELEFMGASMETGMDQESGSAGLAVLKKDLDKGLEIFSDVLENPAFGESKLNIEKAKIAESIRRRNDDPFEIARREYRKLIYGPRHPLSRTEEIPVIRSISRKDLISFYNNYYHPNNMMIAVSGDFQTEEMVSKLETLFKDWKRSDVVFPVVPSVDSLKWEVQGSTGMIKVVGIAGKKLNQASVLLGQLGVKRHNPDRFSLEVMNVILGGSSFTSRLYKSVRSKLGLAYWVGSSFSEPWDFGTISAGCQTKTQTVGQAVFTILKEIGKMREEPVSEEELRMAKDEIVNSFVFRYSSTHAIVSEKMALEYYGYPSDYLDTYTQKIAAVSIQDVQSAAKKYLLPSGLTLMIVGDPENMDVPPREFGFVRTVDLTLPE